jgi:uncharacterized protein YcnI
MTVRRFAFAYITLFLAGSVAAQAHVRVLPVSAPHRATLTLAFRVPDERGRVPTTRVDVQFPQDRPIAIARVESTAGWTGRVRMKSGRVESITWSAGTAAARGTRTFRVVAGPLPVSGDVLYFKTVQTYADGTATYWIQIPNPREAEPPNPAPQLRLQN